MDPVLFSWEERGGIPHFPRLSSKDRFIILDLRHTDGKDPHIQPDKKLPTDLELLDTHAPIVYDRLCRTYGCQSSGMIAWLYGTSIDGVKAIERLRQGDIESIQKASLSLGE